MNIEDMALEAENRWQNGPRDPERWPEQQEEPGTYEDHLTYSRVAENDAADALEEAWVQVQEAWAQALRLLPSWEALRAYPGRMFDADDPVVGGQSMQRWMDDTMRALRGEDDPEMSSPIR